MSVCIHMVVVLGQIFVGGGAVKVGRYCSLGSDTCYIGHNHLMNGVSTSPVLGNNYFLNKFGININENERYQCLDIGNDVWIGSNVVILSNCHQIGNGAIIGAGCIVTKDVPPFAIVAGNPGKIIRYRFDSKTCERLEESKWWDLEPKELMPFYQYFDSPKKFAECIIEYKRNR